VRDFFGEPRITRDDRDPEDFCFRRLDQQEDGLLVRASGTGSVLIDDDLVSAFRLRKKARC
jgi:hypothetical protein